jgi:hypothetical protein
MLAACERRAAATGKRDVYLHVRLGDGAAAALYAAAGYEEAGRDSWVVRLAGTTPRALLHKVLAAAPPAGG